MMKNIFKYLTAFVQALLTSRRSGLTCLIYLLLLVFKPNNLPAQSIQDDVTEARAAMRGVENLKIKLHAVKREFDEAGKVTGTNDQAIEYFFSKNAFQMTTPELEMLINENYIIVVSLNTKLILVQKNTKGNEFDPEKEFAEQFALFSKKISSQKIVQAGTKRKYELKISDFPNSTLEVHYDGILKHFNYYKKNTLDKNNKLESAEEMEFEFLNNFQFEENQFSEKKYVSYDGKKWSAMGKFKSFRVEFLKTQQ